MPDTDKLITIERLKDLLAAYGARPGLWPAEERAAAQALIDTSDDARTLYDEEQALDALLQNVIEPEVSAALTGRVRSMALPTATAPSASFMARLMDSLRPQSRMAWQGAVAMAGILGIVTGMGVSAFVMETNAPAANTIIAISEGDTTLATDNAAIATPNSANVAFSLTGETVTETETNADESDTGEGTFTVAGIPLY